VDLKDIKSANPPDFSFILPKKDRLELDLGTSEAYFPYEDAMPVSMRLVRMADLFTVDIHWKMLTDYRPCNRTEEDYFNRIVDLGKFKRDTRIAEAQQVMNSISSVPGSSVQAKALAMGFVVYKSKRGTLETKMKSCKECGLEMCTGVYCKLQIYDSYSRVILDKDELEAEDGKGFSLKNVIAQANNTKQPGKKEPARSRRKNETTAKPSLSAMIFQVRKRKRKKKKKAKNAENEGEAEAK
jgi:hypothetical protein